MPNFDLSRLALKMVCPTNEIITDDKDMPGCYVQITPQPLSELLGTKETSMKATKAYAVGAYISVAGTLYRATEAIASGDTLTDGTNVAAMAAGSTVHPAFLLSDETNTYRQVNKLYIGKFQGKSHGSRIYSLPGEDPTASITLDNYETYCKNKGTGHHCITAAEWAYLSLLCKRNKTQPWGNNNYGKDSRETQYLAIPSMARDSSNRIQRVATGTGPLTWSHNRQLDGIWDLNGNVSEWCSGIRLVNGQLQVIPYNDAALIDTPTGANATTWRTVNAKATSYSDLFLEIETPGPGEVVSLQPYEYNICLDRDGNHWKWSPFMSDSEDSSRGATFASTTFDDDVSEFCKLYLRAMGLAPEAGDTDYENDYFYANNGAAGRAADRGGSWSSGTNNGVFYVYFGYSRSYSAASFGGRPAFLE